MLRDSNLKPVSWRWFLGGIGVIAVLSALLLLDLRFKGLAWQFFWQQTGEETIAGQLRGMVEVSGNLIRPQPETQALVPIQHADMSPFGINTFLQNETEIPKMRVMLSLISDAGFDWIRQEFPWEDIEVDGRGTFTDSRNVDTLGVVDAWAKYDTIVELATQNDLRIVARLSNPPAWAQNPELGDMSPPTDIQDFVNYAVAVAERYDGQIMHYQIWNEPNIFPEWGAQPPSPIAYTEMLCRTYDALKQVNPDIVVISGAIAPTQSLDGFDYQDLVFLQNMYEAGAGDCFDVMAAQGYGLNSGPTDRRVRFNHFGFARHILYRDIMVNYGDAHKPIWLSEVGWNHILDADLPPEDIAGYGNFGFATQEQAARYTPIGYERAQREWSWIGQLDYWFFTVHTFELQNQAKYYFRMADADYSPDNPTFTLLPVYNTMQAYIADAKAAPVLYRGVHQAESWEVFREDDASLLSEAADAQFGKALESTNLSFNAEGTQIALRIITDNPVRVIMDGTFELERIDPWGDWQDVTIQRTVFSENHHYTLVSETPFLLDSITVDNTSQRSLILAGGIGVIVGLLMLGGVLLVLRRQA